MRVGPPSPRFGLARHTATKEEKRLNLLSAYRRDLVRALGAADLDGEPSAAGVSSAPLNAASSRSVSRSGSWRASDRFSGLSATAWRRCSSAAAVSYRRALTTAIM